MFLPDHSFVEARHADLLRQADQQRLARLAQTDEKPARLDWRRLINPMVNWLYPQPSPEPKTELSCEVVCC